mgnify:CR=1 FL=1|tara:strand:- start:918 stop:1238 length:321 start_codon:yes stop_codon:yes gene_type:complete
MQRISNQSGICLSQNRLRTIDKNTPPGRHLSQNRLKTIDENTPLTDIPIFRLSPASVVDFSETDYESFSRYQNEIRDTLIDEDTSRCYTWDCLLNCLFGKPIRFEF